MLENNCIFIVQALLMNELLLKQYYSKMFYIS